MTAAPEPGLAAGKAGVQFTGLRYRAVLWSVLLAAAGYLGFALWSGWRDVIGAVGKVGGIGIAAALGLSLINYGLRFIRWQLYLSAMSHPMPAGPSFRIYIAGFALTTTPGKAGEMLRGLLLKPLGVPYPVSVAAFFSERLSDLLAIVLLALAGLATYPPAQPLVLVALGLVAVGLLLMTSSTLGRWAESRIKGNSAIARGAQQTLAMLRQAHRCHRPGLLATATALSVVAWAAEAWAFHLVLGWMGVEISLLFAAFVYALSMLAGALTFLPGGLGGAEAVMAGLLVWQGASAADAVAATVLIRLTTLWFAVVLGAGALAISTSMQPMTRK